MNFYDEMVVQIECSVIGVAPRSLLKAHEKILRVVESTQPIDKKGKNYIQQSELSIETDSHLVKIVENTNDEMTIHEVSTSSSVSKEALHDEGGNILEHCANLFLSIIDTYKTKELADFSVAVNGAYVSSNKKLGEKANAFFPVIKLYTTVRPYMDGERLDSESIDIKFSLLYNDEFKKTVTMSTLVSRKKSSRRAINIGLRLHYLGNEGSTIFSKTQLAKLISESGIQHQIEEEGKYLEGILKV